MQASLQKERAPEFAQNVYSSDRERELWEPRIRAIREQWGEIEWRSVAAGVRRAALLTVTPSDLVALSQRAVKYGLSVVPLLHVARSGLYAARLVRAAKDQPGSLRCVVAKLPDAAEFAEYFNKNEQQQMGTALGYPSCCTASFEKYWREGVIDPTWIMASQTKGAECHDRSCTVKGPWQANVLLRWVGVRPVPHLPCSFSCGETVQFASRLWQLARDEGIGEMNCDIEEILSGTVEWTASNGAAEIRSRFVTMKASTQLTDETYSVRWGRLS